MTNDIRPIQDILVPTDFSAGSAAALEFAKRLAVSSSARIHLLYVDDDPMLMDHSTDQAYRDQHATKMSVQLRELLPHDSPQTFETDAAVRFGTAYHEIIEHAAEKQIDLIVMGNVGRSALADAVLGSVTANVIRHAGCPVLSVKR